MGREQGFQQLGWSSLLVSKRNSWSLAVHPPSIVSSTARCAALLEFLGLPFSQSSRLLLVSVSSLYADRTEKHPLCPFVVPCPRIRGRDYTEQRCYIMILRFHNLNRASINSGTNTGGLSDMGCIARNRLSRGNQLLLTSPCFKTEIPSWMALQTCEGLLPNSASRTPTDGK